MKLFKAIYKFFFYKDISKVLAAFEKPLNDLKKVQAQAESEVNLNNQAVAKKIEELRKLEEAKKAENAVHAANKTKAETVQKNLEKLLGLDINNDGQIG